MLNFIGSSFFYFNVQSSMHEYVMKSTNECAWVHLMESITWPHFGTPDMYTWVRQVHLMYKPTSIGSNCLPTFT